MESHSSNESDVPDSIIRHNPVFRKWFVLISSTPELGKYRRPSKAPYRQLPKFEDVFRALLAKISVIGRRKTTEVVEAIRFLGQLAQYINGWKQNLERDELRRSTSVLGNLLISKNGRIAREAANALISFAKGECAYDVCEIIAHFNISACDSVVAVKLLNALRAAGQDAAAIAVPGIIRSALGHNDSAVKVVSCALLAELNEDGAPLIDDLIVLMSRCEEEEAVRATALRALSSLSRLPSLRRPEQVRKALLNSAVNDASDAVKLLAIDQLSTMDGHSADQVTGLLCKELREAADGTAIISLIEALRRAGEAYRALRLALGAGDSSGAHGVTARLDAIRTTAIKFPTLPRNLRFLGQYEDSTSETYHSFAAIRDKFKRANPHAKMSGDERGCDTIKKGIKRARKFLKDNNCTATEVLRMLASPSDLGGGS